jgi:predicted negative regulator of RcsB-dependent stress response
MLRKIIWLVVLLAVGYVGYRIWQNLNDQERTAVKSKAEQVLDKTTEGLKGVADKLTETTKESIDKHLLKEAPPTEEKAPQAVKPKTDAKAADAKNPDPSVTRRPLATRSGR